MEIKDGHVKWIKQSGGAIAVALVQEMCEDLERIREIFKESVDQRWAKAIEGRIKSGYEPGELEELRNNPAFVMALIGLLNESLERLNNGGEDD